MKKEKSLIEKSKEFAKGSKDFKTIKVVTNYKGRISSYTIQRGYEKQKENHSIACCSGVEGEKSNSSTIKTYETDAKFEKAIQRIQRIKKKSIPITVFKKKAPAKKPVVKKSPAKKVISKKPVLKVVKKEVLKMSESQIKERIAESGKMTIKDITSYFKKYEGKFDPIQLKNLAKEMIAEAKKHN